MLAQQDFSPNGRARKSSGVKLPRERKTSQASPNGNSGGMTTISQGSAISSQNASFSANKETGVVDAEFAATATTVMLRNIPNRYTQSMLVDLVNEQGFSCKFDFIYLPMDFRNGVNLGYAFVNLTTHEDAMALTNLFQGFSGWSCDSAKVCEVSWAHPHQGLKEHVERYRNSPVMHHSMPEDFKPMIFNNGIQVTFPPPTKPIRAPKLRAARERSGMSGEGLPIPM
jgi:hypothetical protein